MCSFLELTDFLHFRSVFDIILFLFSFLQPPNLTTSLYLSLSTISLHHFPFLLKKQKLVTESFDHWYSMGQQSLIYSFVARGTLIIAEHSDFTGNFTTIALQCLQKLPASNNRFTYNCDGHTFSFLVDNGFSNNNLFFYTCLVTSYILLN